MEIITEAVDLTRLREMGHADYARRAFERALELLDLTIADVKHRSRLRELTRLREVLADTPRPTNPGVGTSMPSPMLQPSHGEGG